MITVLQLWLGEVRPVELDKKKLGKIREENSTDLKKESVCVMCVCSRQSLELALRRCSGTKCEQRNVKQCI